VRGKAVQRLTTGVNKQPAPSDLGKNDRVTGFILKINENLTAFQRAAIIIIILVGVFLISVPSIVVGTVARTKNTTCAPNSANWLIVFGCIGVSEAIILIIFVSNFFQVFHFINRKY
jgi:hypothetical protein